MGAPILFITGTDTAVGKTTIACRIITAVCKLGFRVNVMKPLETGCLRNADGSLFGADTNALWCAAGKTQDLSRCSVYLLEKPVAPSVAAELESVDLDPEKIVARIQSEAENCDLLIVEGAGGLLVPISPQFSFADLALRVGSQAIVVVGSRLGAINSALLTFEALSTRGIRCLGYILNEPISRREQPVGQVAAIKTNQAALAASAHFYAVPELGYFHHEADGAISTSAEQLGHSVLKSLGLLSPRI